MTTELTIWISAGIAICGTAVLFFLWRGGQDKVLRYRVTPFLTKAQEAFLENLYVAAPGCYIFPNVPVSSLLEPSSVNGKRDAAKARELQKSTIDFALYDSGFRLLCVIDLHDEAKDAERDTRHDRYFKHAGVKLLRWDVDSKPSVEQISRKVSSLGATALGRNTATRQGPDTLMMTAPDTVMAIRGSDPIPVMRNGLSVAMLEQLTPKKIIQTNHSHIWERLSLFAVEPRHLHKYLSSLLIQDRGEERSGFLPEVLKELADIKAANDRFLGTTPTGWHTSIVNI